MGIYDDGPRVVIWEMTRACALACKHCRAQAVPHRDERELTTNEAFDFIDEIAAYGRPIFILTGGDPFMRPDIFEIVRHAVANGLPIAVSPSGTGRLSSFALHELAEAGCHRISLSLDGSDAATHDAFRGVGGVFERTIQAAARAHEAGIGVQINTTIGRHNAHQLPALAELVASIDASIWSAFFLVPTGRAQREDCLSADEFETAFGELYNVMKTAPYLVKTTEAPHFRRYVAQQLARLPRDERPPRGEQLVFPAIGDGKGFVFVSHTGEIAPSGFLPIVTGNVRDDSLLDVYRNDPMFQRLRDPDRTNGKCGTCDFRTICGGSRARAYSFTGDPFGSDPCCAYRAPDLQSAFEGAFA